MTGQRSRTSSMGPTRDKRIAPDIAAPGEVITAALSSQLTPGIGYYRSSAVQGGHYQVLQGSSLAAAHVTGVIALMLQANPWLDYDRAIQILQTTALADQFTGSSLPDNRFGAGKVHAPAAVQTTLNQIIDVPGDYATIQDAINAAHDFDTILVAPGSYPITLGVPGVVNMRVNGLRLVGSTNIDGSPASIIYNTTENQISMAFSNVSECLISGFAFTGGSGAIYFVNCNHCIVSGNYFHDTRGSVVTLHGCNDATITYNIMDNTGNAVNVNYCSYTTIHNNTIIRVSQGNAISIGSGNDHISLKNNIIAYTMGASAIGGCWDCSDFDNDYNCFWQNTMGDTHPPNTIGPNSIFADPMLVDTNAQNYSLLPDSPCIGAGVGGVDIGARGLE